MALPRVEKEQAEALAQQFAGVKKEDLKFSPSGYLTAMDWEKNEVDTAAKEETKASPTGKSALPGKNIYLVKFNTNSDLISSVTHDQYTFLVPGKAEEHGGVGNEFSSTPVNTSQPVSPMAGKNYTQIVTKVVSQVQL